ncbi:hypothetical protein K438DRAFT_2101068 [Mycena galopus ATCC 62051]|nr:hypothetical protein K438DRAFT_2101068 [Mycena galopus ATCC 62051]
MPLSPHYIRNQLLFAEGIDEGEPETTQRTCGICMNRKELKESSLSNEERGVCVRGWTGRVPIWKRASLQVDAKYPPIGTNTDTRARMRGVVRGARNIQSNPIVDAETSDVRCGCTKTKNGREGRMHKTQFLEEKRAIEVWVWIRNYRLLRRWLSFSNVRGALGKRQELSPKLIVKSTPVNSGTASCHVLFHFRASISARRALPASTMSIRIWWATLFF